MSILIASTTLLWARFLNTPKNRAGTEKQCLVISTEGIGKGYESCKRLKTCDAIIGIIFTCKLNCVHGLVTRWMEKNSCKYCLEDGIHLFHYIQRLRMIKFYLQNCVSTRDKLDILDYSLNLNLGLLHLGALGLLILSGTRAELFVSAGTSKWIRASEIKR